MSTAACTGSFSLGFSLGNFTLMALGCRYKAQADLPQPCWAGVDNWMNGQIYAGKPSTTPGWPGWIHGVTWGPRPMNDSWARGQRSIDVALPAAAKAVVAQAGPRKKRAVAKALQDE